MNCRDHNSPLNFNRSVLALTTCLVCIMQTGCVSIVSNSSGTNHGLIRKAAHSNHIQSLIANFPSCDPACEEPCPLYDRREVLARTVSAMSPSNWMPQSVKNLGAKTCEGAANCRDRMASWYYTKCEWVEKKRAEANAPPWPRFHPVPTKPVFAPTEGYNPTEPECYGRFGKAD